MGARQRAHVRVAVPRLPRRYRAPHGPLQGFGPLPVVDETTVRNNKKGGKKEERKRKEASKGGRKERIRRGAFPFRTCTLRLATSALCVVSRASRKKGRKEEEENEEEEEEKRDRGVSLAVEGWW